MTLTRASFIAAPLCLVAYGTIRLIGQQAPAGYGPGLAWVSGHLLALLGFLLFVPVLLALGGALPRSRGVTAIVVVGLAGIAAVLVQFGVDVVAALGASDHAAMSATERAFGALPGVNVAFYDVGPQLFYLALIVLMALLAVAGKTPWWAAVLVAGGLSLPVLTLALLPVGALLVLAGLVQSSASPVPVSG